MSRLFFALQPELAQRIDIAAAVQPLAQALGARPVPAANLHLTLCFLGEVTEQRLPPLQEAVSDFPPVRLPLTLTHLDYWPASRVLCLLPEQTASLRSAGALAQQLHEAARSAGLFIDEKPFRAHVTVGRKVSATRPPRHWPEPLQAPLPFISNGFVLLQSSPGPEGSHYLPVRAWRAA
jgi:2'-5' RNA ligase